MFYHEIRRREVIALKTETSDEVQTDFNSQVNVLAALRFIAYLRAFIVIRLSYLALL